MAKSALSIVNKKYNGIDTAALDFHGQKPSAEVRNFMKSNNWIWNSNNVPPVWQPNIRNEKAVNESYNFISQFAERFADKYEFSDESKRTIKSFAPDVHAEDPQIEFAQELADQAINDEPELDNRDNIISELQRQILELQKELKSLKADKTQKYQTPELNIYHTLKEEDIKNLEVVTDEDFSDIVDSIILNDYQHIPNAIRLPNLNEELSEKLGLEKNSAFILKKNATHIRPDRKGSYDQALRVEEYREIPKIMREATFALIDTRIKNFQIIFDDKENISKINKLVFNKDELGNYLVTTGKVDRRDGISENYNMVVGVGVAPTISALRFPEELPATRLRPSPTTHDESITQNNYLSNENKENEPLIINTKSLLNNIDEMAREEEKAAERNFIDDNMIVEGEEVNDRIIITPDELDIVKNILPTAQYLTTLQLSRGEEGEHFKKKIKDIAKAVKNAPKIYQTEGVEEHPIILRYFHATGTETLVTEIGKDGEAFGYQVLNGNYEWAEWGYIDLNEVKDIPGIQVDYHIPEGMTVERWLYKEKPELYSEYAKFSEEKKIEKTPFDIAQETGNDVEAISAALNKTKSVENDKDYAKGLADWIIQHGLEMSTDQENYHVSFDDILEYTDTPEDWLNNPVNIQLINEALSEHDDNELLDYNPEENEEKEFNLYFCSNSDEMVENTLFKQNKEGRWVRKTEEELLNEKNQTVSLEMSKEQYDTLSERYVEAKDSIKTNFVLDKLSAAGIEVITDKSEFDRILESQIILQKMTEENKIEDLFVSSNDENLNSEIDKLTIKDIDSQDNYIEISKETPYIFKECGLENYPVNIYKQKLARAFFLEKEKYGERRTHGHKGEFTSKEAKEVFENISNPRYVFLSKANVNNPDYRLIGVYDVFDNKGEPMMLSFHFNKNRKEIEANWVTSIYGKNKNILVDDWTKHGYLIYENDLEIEKAPAEVVTLYMRVSKSASAVNNNLIRKSDIVNKMNISLYKQNDNIYGFAHNGKIYLNPEIMNSEVAVHEYTHLWDNYIQRVNPELWHKGLDIFKNTKFWNEVKADPNYADIAHDDNLLLSEVHAKICGKMAELILEKIIERDGELTKNTVIDWDKECWDYIATEIGFQTFNKVDPSLKITTEDLKQFLSMPMKDLMNSVNINLEQQADKIFSIFNKYISNEEYATEKANKFIKGWEKKDFNSLAEELVFKKDTTAELRKLFNETEKVSLPEGNSNHLEVYTYLTKFADVETIPTEGKFNTWNDVIDYDIEVRTSLENKKNTFYFFQTHTSQTERTNYLKKEYSNRGGGVLPFNYVYTSDGIYLKALIDGKIKEKSYTWAEYTKFISDKISQGTYYTEPKIEKVTNKLIPSFNLLNEKYAMEFEPAEEGKIEVNSEADKWIVKFFDVSKTIPGEIDKGRFIQKYYASSLLQNQNSTVGLNLGYGWSLDAETFNRAKEIIKDFVSINMSNIFSSKQNINDEYSESLSEYSKELIKNNNSNKFSFILDKLSAAGIEVITDKSEFDEILESQTILQKMSIELSEIEKLSKQLNEESEKSKKLEKEVKQNSSDIQHQNYNEFMEFLESVRDYIPEEKDFSEKININGDSYYFKLANRIPINFDSNGADEWIVKPDNNKEKKIYIVSNHYNHLRDVDNYEDVKQYFADRTILTTFQESLTSFLKKNISLEKEKQKHFINDLDKQTEELKTLEKREAYKTVSDWLYEAEEKAPDLWAKDQLQVKKYFLENGIEERKFIGIIPSKAMVLFEGVEDYHLYADKSYLIDHYINRHYDNRLFENIQNVIDNYTNIYFDSEQNSICFAKKYGNLADCVFVHVEDGKIILFGSTYNQPEFRLHNERYKKITPVQEQEQNVSLEGSTPLSHNSNGKAAVAISDVNDKINIPQNENKSSQLDDGSLFVTQMTTKKIQANIVVKSPNDVVPYLNEFAKSEVENFGVVMLDSSHKIKEIRTISVGTVNRSLVHAREVFKEAVRNSAANILIFHNHPSGSLEPSNDDIETTKRLVEASTIMGIPILDHIIVSTDGYFSFKEYDLLNEKIQNYITQDGTTYGFAYNGKIYLNPDIVSSEAAIHEYTHIWDNYVQRNNPELWNKGKEVFKNTYLWEEVKNDSNYQDIANDEDLILSECHARITGKIADQIFDKILQENGELAKDSVIDWDKEVFEYIAKEFSENEIDIKSLSEFVSQPMKDFMEGKKLDLSKTVQQEKHLSQISGPLTKKEIKNIREQCREILQKSDEEITEADKLILAQYEGAGGINEENRTDSGILNEFYTPNHLVKTVWDIVDSYAPGAKTVLEPSAGVGKFANNRPNNEFTMHELDETSARINKILHPNANIIQGAYQKQFFDEYGISRKTDFVQPKYDVVIGNPPYGKYLDEWKGKGEGKEFDRYEEYFISKGLDALKDENSVMAFVVPSGFLNNANDKQKHLIASKGILVDAYRLPVGAFPTTEVGTDIIIMKNRELCIDETYGERWENLDKEQREDVVYTEWQRISNGRYFDEHPEKILGEVKTKTNRFGKPEEYVKVHEGLTVQDELNKINSMLPKVEAVRVENKNIHTNNIVSEQKLEVIEATISDKNAKIFATLNSLDDTNYFLTEGFGNQHNINTKKDFWKHLDSYNFRRLVKDMDNSINGGWHFKVFFNANTNEAMLSYRNNVIATINKRGVITENFDSSSKDYKDLSKNVKDRIDLRVREFNEYIKHIQFSYLGNKNNSVYFRNANYRNGFNITIIDNDKLFELTDSSTNVYGSIIGTSMSGNIYENIEREQQYSDFKPLYASFESLYPENNKIDLEKILEDDRQITMAVESEIENLVEPPEPNWRSSGEDYSRQKEAREKYEETKRRLPYNEMLKFSKLSENDYQEKVKAFTVSAAQKRNEEIEKVIQEQKDYEDKALMFDTIVKEKLEPGKSFEYMYIPIRYEQAKEEGAINIYIDEEPAFCINETKKSIFSYNNYDIPKEYLRYWNEIFDGEITVGNIELEDTEKKISLSNILSEKTLSDNVKKSALKVAEFFADRDFSAFKKEESEQNPSKVLEIGNHKYKVESYGIHRRLFIDGSRYVAADFDIKTNILSMNNDCYKHNLYEGLEEVCRNMYPNISVKKNFIVDNTHYEDVDGTTNILPMISKVAYEPKKTELLNDKDFAKIYGINWNHEDRKYWVATDWKGYIDLEKISPDDEKALPQSEHYFEESNGKWIHKTLFTSGNIYKKIDENEKLYQEGQLSETSYKKNKAALEQAIPKKIEINDIAVSVKSPFVRNLKFDNVPVKELFLNWATGAAFGEDSGNSRNYITDFTTSSISREDIPPTITWSDVVDYCDDIELKSIRDDEKTAKEKTDIRNQKLNDRKATAEILFKRFIQNGLTKEQQNVFVDQFNRTFNSDKAPDYSTLPLFISGMNKWHNGKEFTLYEQQIKGISFLSNKGNGLLAYDVGVGKTAAGICATVNQIQTGRAKRPFIVVPKSVYKKWENDIHELFPEIQVNALGNLSEKVIGNYYDGNHGLKIPKGSITLLTNEALNNIAFTEKSIKNDLKQDYADLLALNEDLSSDNDRTRAEANGKILDKAGVSNKVDNSYFVFFENTGFDHVTVDEAHRFKNLFKVPRPKKGQNNEFANMGTGEPSKRALKMFNITQLIQKHNEGRNVFMLTATPFTNSPLEVYSMLSYIARKELEQQNIKDLYNFCEEYSNTRLELVVTPSNDVKLSTVMKEFNNLNGLQNILKQFIDKVDGEEADIVRPDKVVNPVIIEPTDVQKEIFDFAANEVLTYKPENEEEKCAPVLQAMNILRIAALSPALLTEKHLTPFMDPEVSCSAVIPPIEEVVDCSPKLKMCCDSIVKVWKENPACGQVLYMPEGTDAYPHIINYMVKQGVPREVFATIEGTDATIGGKKLKGADAREDIAQQFNDKKNKCKILIGSSAISEGMDLNGNSVALYNTMLGWNPSETIQVEGRIWRQGNQQGRVHIVYPLVEGSIDSFLYQKHDEKKSRIDDLFRYKGSTLNVAEINPEEMKWELIKDPRKRAELDLNEAKAKLNREKLMLDNQLKDYDSLIENRKLYSEKLEKRKQEKAEYENNYQQSLFDGKQRRTEEEQAAGVARYDLSISKIEGQLTNINRKLAGLDIKTSEDEINFSQNIVKKQQEIDKQIENLTSPANVMNITGKYQKIIQQEKIANLEKMLTEPLNQIIVKDMIPAHINEYNVREMRYKAVIENIKSTPEQIEKATKKWEKFKKEYGQKYNNIKPKEENAVQEVVKPVIKKNTIEKPVEKTTVDVSQNTEQKSFKATDQVYQYSLFQDNESEQQKPVERPVVQLIECKELFEENSLKNENSVLNHRFMTENNFYPPFIKNGSNYLIRCNYKDVVMSNGSLNTNPVDIELTKEQFAQMIAYHKAVEKLCRAKKSIDENITPQPLTPAAVFTDKANISKISEKEKALIKETIPGISDKDAQVKWQELAGELSEQVKAVEQNLTFEQKNENTVSKQNLNFSDTPRKIEEPEFDIY